MSEDQGTPAKRAARAAASPKDDAAEGDGQWTTMAKPGVKVEWMWPPGHKNRGTLTGKVTEKSVHAVTDKSGSNKYLPKSRFGNSGIANGWQLV